MKGFGIYILIAIILFSINPILFFSVLFFFFFTSYLSSKKQDKLDNGLMRLPTWVSKNTFLKIYKASDTKGRHNFVRFYKMLAAIERKSKKQKQSVFQLPEVETPQHQGSYDAQGYKKQKPRKSRISISNYDENDTELFDDIETEEYLGVPTITQETPARSYLRKQKENDKLKIINQYLSESQTKENNGFTTSDSSYTREELYKKAPVKTITCPKCDMVFETESPQVCHLADCYYD